MAFIGFIEFVAAMLGFLAIAIGYAVLSVIVVAFLILLFRVLRIDEPSNGEGHK